MRSSGDYIDKWEEQQVSPKMSWLSCSVMMRNLKTYFNQKKGKTMFHAFGSKSRSFLASLLCLFAFVLFVGSLTAVAGSDAGAKKGCDPKACTKTCPMMMKASSQDAAQEEKSDAALVFNLKDFSMVEGYTCPMHPAVKSEKSGKCPECGGKLVKGDFYEVYTCDMKECTLPCVHPKPGQCCGKELQKTMMTKEEMYQSARLQGEYCCPMHPDQFSDKPCNCSKCGMTLKRMSTTAEQKGSTQ
jgi:hypothetical protein